VSAGGPPAEQDAADPRTGRDGGGGEDAFPDETCNCDPVEPAHADAFPSESDSPIVDAGAPDAFPDETRSFGYDASEPLDAFPTEGPAQLIDAEVPIMDASPLSEDAGCIFPDETDSTFDACVRR
jgi:hypothetical protein